MALVSTPTAENKRHGVGLVKQLMQQVNGSFDVQSDDGTQWTLSFPMLGAI